NTEEESVPPLVLQPYAENALWHGLSNKEGSKKLGIKIFASGNYLIVEIIDNGIGRLKASEIKSKNAIQAASQGLNITKRRLTLLNDEDISPVTIEDLYNENGNAAGTKVILKIYRTSNE